jgi:sugar diacid utilization regulator
MQYLSSAKELNINSEVNLLLAQAHKEIGDFHFEVASDLTALQQVKESYEIAIKYYEIARYDDPFSKEIIEDLLDLSMRLDDQTRVEEYEELLKLAGG